MTLADEYETATYNVIAAGKVLADCVRDGDMTGVLITRGLFDRAWEQREAAYEAYKAWKDAQ